MSTDSSRPEAIPYNYEHFTAETADAHWNWAGAPPLGQRAPDFTLFTLDGLLELPLRELCRRHALTVIELGSYS